MKFDTAEHALPAPVSSPLWVDVDRTLSMGTGTDTEDDMAAGLFVNSEWEEVILQTTRPAVFYRVCLMNLLRCDHARVPPLPIVEKCRASTRSAADLP